MVRRTPGGLPDGVGIISSNTATSHLRRAWPGLAVPGLPLLAGRSRRNDWDQAMWNVLAEGWLSDCHLRPPKRRISLHAGARLNAIFNYFNSLDNWHKSATRGPRSYTFSGNANRGPREVGPSKGKKMIQSIKRVFCVAAVTFGVAVYAPTASSVPVDLELVLLTDVSGSVDGTDFNLMNNGMCRRLKAP